MRRILAYAVYLFLTLVFQNMVLNRIHPLGVCAFVLPSVVVAVGMFEGAVWGAVFGLVMGYFADMFFVESTLMFTVLFPFLAFASGFVSQFFINRRFFAFMIAALAAGIVTALFQVLRVIVTDEWSLAMFITAAEQVIWTIPVSVLAYFPSAKWIE